MVRERIPVQSEHGFVRLPLQFESLGIDVSCLEIYFAVVELENRNVAVSVNWHIVWVRWYKRIDHHTVEAAIDLLGDVTEYNLYGFLAYSIEQSMH